MVAARDDGLIGGIGLSNISLDQLRHALAGTDIVCVQNLFHIADRSGAPVLEECLDRGIAFRTVLPARVAARQGQPGDDQPGTRADRRSARRHARTGGTAVAAEVAPNVLLIPGTGSIEHMPENLAAEALTLDAAALRTLDGVAG
jgi:aryl-alcohol dehydrogenase-like predicted oxidoreductase